MPSLRGLLSIHSYMHAFVHERMHSSIHSFICSFIPSFIICDLCCQAMQIFLHTVHTHRQTDTHTHMSGPSGAAHQQVMLVNSLRHELGPVLPVICACCPHSLHQRLYCFSYIESLHCQVADRQHSYCFIYTEPLHSQVAACQQSYYLRRSEPLATRWLNVSTHTV